MKEKVSKPTLRFREMKAIEHWLDLAVKAENEGRIIHSTMYFAQALCAQTALEAIDG
jgi:phage I-like protein